MTKRERFDAFLRGESLSPALCISDAGDPDADVLAMSLSGETDAARLAIVRSPLWHAQNSGFDLRTESQEDPDAAAASMQRFAATASGAAAAAAEWADGLLYILHGADPNHTTPMEYGGILLDLDREILSGVTFGPRFVFVSGTEEPYLDFVSDLPCEAFGWESSLAPSKVAELRRGPFFGPGAGMDAIYRPAKAPQEELMNAHV